MTGGTEAAIKTASVDMQTFTIGGRKVTLTVFRQIREEELLADDCSLLGEPWGIVNYHPDGCKGFQPHWHVVWTRGADLRRARVYERGYFDWSSNWSKSTRVFKAPEVDRLIVSELHEWVHQRIDEESMRFRRPEHAWGFDVSWNTTEGDMPVRGLASPAAVNAARRWMAVVDPDLATRMNRQVMMPKVTEDFEAARLALDVEVAAWGLTRSQVIAQYEAVVKAEQERRDRERAVRAQLGTLPQLFITV